MPLKKGYSQKTVSANIREEGQEVSREVRQALAFVAGAVLWQVGGPWWTLGAIGALIADEKLHKTQKA